MRKNINGDKASGDGVRRTAGKEVHYEIRVRFTTDQPISELDLGNMMNAVAVQVEEPWDVETGSPASFSTRWVEVNGGEV